MQALGFYILAMFCIGATHSLRLGLAFAFFSSLAGSIAVLQYRVGAWQLFLVQLGVFVGACALWLLVSLLKPRAPRATQVSATHSSAGGPAESATVGPGMLAFLAVLGVILLFFALIFFGPAIPEDAVLFFMITGIVGVALVIALLAPFISGAIALAQLVSILRRKDKGNQP